MYLPIVSIKKFLPLLIVGLCVMALSACGTGGGPDPEDRSPVSFQLLGGHGLTAGEITISPGAAEEHGNVVVSCPAGGEACVLNVAADGSASYQRSGGMPSFMPALASQMLPGGHGLASGEITVAPGAAEEHGNVVVSCPAGGEACVLNVAAGGSASYQKTGGVPSVMAALVSWRVPAGDGRMAASLNGLPGLVRNNVAGRLALTATRSVVSSTASTTNVAPITGGTWNTGVTQAPVNTDPDSPGDNRAINAGYLRRDLVFERINFELGLRHDTRAVPRPPGYRTAIPPAPDAPQWKGVEHFFIPPSGGRYYSVFHSDIEDNDDSDYLALGYWAWTPGPGGTRGPFVGAAASGNDPFQVGLVAAVAGRATYAGAATGLYAGGDAPSAFRGFGAGVKLTADFDENSIVGLVTDGRDSATDEQLFRELVLETAAIQDADAAFFRADVSGLLNGQTVEGNWGGQFYGNGPATTDIPVSFAEPPGSVAGTFGARVVGGDSLLGVFGAYKEE